MVAFRHNMCRHVTVADARCCRRFSISSPLRGCTYTLPRTGVPVCPRNELLVAQVTHPGTSTGNPTPQSRLRGSAARDGPNQHRVEVLVVGTNSACWSTFVDAMPWSATHVLAGMDHLRLL